MKLARSFQLTLFCIMGFAGAQMAHATSATGGNATNVVGSYRVHTFTNSGTFVVASGGNVDVLVVAGGGGGGANGGGGGGGGGLIYTNSFAVTNNQSVSVTVGSGGTGSSSGNTAGTAGSDSVFGALTAKGGGGGASRDNGSNAGSQGSGGGGGGAESGSRQTGGTATAGQGCNGGNGVGGSANAAGGGGGGSGTNGTAATANHAGNGGTGLVFSISGTATNYAGGGGGGLTVSPGTIGTGGAGGGGGGAYGSTNPGVPNTGGGGGGGSGGTPSGNGGNGGSGIVIVRYLVSAPGAPVIVNAVVSNITFGAAFFNGSILSTGAAPVTAVTVYWGTADGGTNASMWSNTNALAGTLWNQGDVVTTNMGGLSPNATYFYTFAANNASGTTFAVPSISFQALGGPSVVNAGVVSNNVTLATLQGQVIAGNPTPQVYVCWGTVDAGTSGTSAWQNVVSGGTQAGAFVVIATNLTSVGPYYYRCYATNAVGCGWSPTAVKFMEGQRVALMAAWKIPTNAITTAGVLDPTFAVAATNGTLLIYTNSQFDAHLDSGQVWKNYGTFGASGSDKGPGLFGFIFTNLPRFVGATINRSQFLLYQSNGYTPGTGNRWLDYVTTFAWSEGNKNGDYPGNAPAARGASWAHPNGINTANSQNSNGGTATPWYSWGPNTNAAFAWGTDTAGSLHAPQGAGGGDPYDPLIYTVTDIATAWASGTKSNFGFCVNFNYSGDNYQFYYREYNLIVEPVLFIDYTPAPDTPVVQNYPGATNVLYNTADLGGVLSSTGSAPTEVRVYYGRRDQYPSTNGWDGVAEIGNPQGVGPFVAHVSGLLDGTGYVYRCYATNSFGDNWATQATTFATLPLALTINNASGATGVTARVAWLNGYLLSTGGAPTAVWVFLGTNGATGGISNTDKTQWQTNYFLGNNIPFQTYLTANATGLQYSTTYYYSYYASNALGNEAWAGVTNFQTLAPIDYVATNNAAWNLNSTWKPSTGYPNYPDDSATIASNTVTASGYAVPSIRYINITTNANGSKTGTLYHADATMQAAPLQLGGGILQLDVNGPSQESGPVTVKNESQIYVIGQGNYANGNVCTMSGNLSDSVQGGVTNTGVVHVYGSYRAKVRYSGISSNFSGGWDIVGGPGTYSCAGLGGTGTGGGSGGMVLDHDGGLGTGTTTVRNRLVLTVDQTNAPAPARAVVVNGGELQLDNDGSGANPRYVSNWDVELQSGATLSLGPGGIGAFTGGHLFMTGNATMFGYRDGRGWGPDNRYGGQIVGAGRLTINAQVNGDIGPFRLSGNNTNFSGGVTLLRDILSVEHTNALGTGDCWFNSANGQNVNLNSTPATNWSLANNIGGINTIQVQDGTSNYTLTVAGGTLQPGTNVNASGKLTVSGRMQFAPKPAGGYATLVVDVTGYNGVAGVDYDQLAVTRGGLTGTLSQCDLQIKVVPTVEQLDQQTLTIVSSPNDNFTGQAFHSVTWVNGVGGQILVTNIVYNNGSIQLQFASSDPVINNANGATGIGPTSASINGNLTGVGSAATHVYAYWGASDGGTNAGNWHAAVDLGVRGTGAVTTAISGLQGDTVYYYRYYAVNANGGQWAPSTASFRTLLNPFEFSRKMQIRFNGYNRTEALTNFPALVVLSPGITGFKYSAFASPAGYDLRFANSNLTKTLSYEVEKWDATSNSCIWVQVDRLASSNDYIWAYYGNPLAASAPPSYSTNGSTWSQGFLGVWHMSQTNALDSTPNQFNGAAQGTVTPTNGIVASANNVLGSSGYVKVPYNPAFDMASDYTVGTWIFSTNSGSRGFLGTYNSNNNGFIFGQNGTTVQFWDNGNWHDSTYVIDTVTGVWKYLVYVRTNTVGSFMVDGAVVGPQIVNAGGPISGTDLYLGAAHWNDSFRGRMDETRLATIARSTNWVWAEYMNMASNGAFATFGQPVNLKTGTSIIFQ